MKAFCDVHLHNYLSKCARSRTATAENMILQAAELGLKRIGFANHIWDARVAGNNAWYQRQTLEYSMQIKNQIPADTHGVEVLIGAETEYCGRSKTLGMTAEGAQELDYLLIPHSHIHMLNFVMDDPAPLAEARDFLKKELMKIPGMTREQVDGWVDPMREPALRPFIHSSTEGVARYIADFLVDSFESLLEHPELHKILKTTPVAIAHPFQHGDEEARRVTVELVGEATFERLFKKVASMGIGIEINPECDEPAMIRMNTIAKACGCKFTIGSDAHAPGSMNKILRTEAATNALNLTKDDLMDFLIR